MKKYIHSTLQCTDLYALPVVEKYLLLLLVLSECGGLGILRSTIAT